MVRHNSDMFYSIIFKEILKLCTTKLWSIVTHYLHRDTIFAKQVTHYSYCSFTSGSLYEKYLWPMGVSIHYYKKMLFSLLCVIYMYSCPWYGRPGPWYGRPGPWCKWIYSWRTLYLLTLGKIMYCM